MAPPLGSAGGGGTWGCGAHLLTPPLTLAESLGGSPQSKHLIEDLIIESSRFPAAQPPDPNQPAKIETDYWPCPPSLAVVGRRRNWATAERQLGRLPPPSLRYCPQPQHLLPTPPACLLETEWRKRKASRRGAEEEEEEEEDDSGDEMKALRERQKEELSKVPSCAPTAAWAVPGP